MKALVQAQDPSTTPDVLQHLAGHWYDDVIIAVAGNPNTAPTTLQELARSDDSIDEVLVAVAGNPNTQPSTLQELARLDITTDDVLVALAGNPNTPRQLLITFAQEGKAPVRCRVATNPSMPPEALMELASDQGFYIRREVAKNLNTPPATLHKLAELGFVAAHKIKDSIFPGPYLEIMIPSPYNLAHLNVAKNPNTHSMTLGLLAGSDYLFVRIAVAEHHNTLPATLQQLAGDDFCVFSSDVRIAVADNPNTSFDVLWGLLRDSNHDVKQTALSALRSRQGVSNAVCTSCAGTALSAMIR
jgi:hypothetical protein